MSILQQTISARDIQREYRQIVKKVQNSDKPVIVISRNQPQLAMINLKILEEYQRLKDFAFLDKIRSKNKNKSFVGLLDEIDQALTMVRKRHLDE